MISSLLWKSPERKKTFSKNQYEDIKEDLNLSGLLNIMSKEPSIILTPEIFLGSVTHDYADIVYRQSILRAFIKRDNIVTELEELIMLLDRMTNLHKTMKSEMVVPSIILRLKKLELYCQIMKKMEKVFSSEDKDITDDFKKIALEIRRANNEKGIEELSTGINRIKEILSNIKSIDIGVNLNADLDVLESIILSTNNYKYDKSNIIDKVTSFEKQDFDMTSVASEIDISNANQLLILKNELYKEFGELLKDEIQIIDSILEKFKHIITSEVLPYREEICLYFGAVRMCGFMNLKGYGYCFPKEDKNETVLDGLYSINIAHMKAGYKNEDKYKVVKNHVVLGIDKGFMLITGPNDGGKTILMEGMGICHLLFQNGLIIPADSAKLPVYNQIFTHYPKDENIDAGAGRLGEEACRISDIFDKSNSGTLILLNEPYITTSPTEGLDILVMSLCKFREKHSVVYLVTHYLSILDELGDTSEAVSYVMQIENEKRTYKTKQEPPMSESFASWVAKEHGVDYKGLMSLIKEHKQGIAVDGGIK